MRVDGEDVDQLEGGEDVGRSEQALSERVVRERKKMVRTVSGQYFLPVSRLELAGTSRVLFAVLSGEFVASF